MKQSNNIDLTVIFLTVNKLPEKWVKFHREKLLKAVGDYPIIAVSRVPMPEYELNIIQDGEICADNVYRQILRACKIATTPYIAIVEDDSLYPYDHFHSFRPAPNEFAYNMSRWSLYDWRAPMYSWRDRISNLTLIAPRELAIKCLEERFEKYPDPLPDHMVGEMGKPKVEAKLGLPHYPIRMWNSDVAVLNINHKYSMDDREIRQVKKPGSLRAYDIPHWGHAKTIMAQFND